MTSWKAKQMKKWKQINKKIRNKNIDQFHLGAYKEFVEVFKQRINI